MSEEWTPILGDGPASLYERLVDALRSDVETGVLAGGTRLPPQRTLAAKLKLSVGTVTKAYIEAERRGLVVGQVGRGTFVASDASQDGDGASGQSVDLSVNIIPHQAAARRFADSMAALKRRPDAFDAMAYAPPAGTERARAAARTWISEVAHLEVDVSRLVMTTGAQQAMSLAFGLLCRAGDTVLCEEVTFYGMKSLAEHAGLTLRGVEMDAQGIVPEALERAARETRARVAYLMPTVQNPTARTMSKKRRRDVVEVVERLGLWVVEDDNYAMFAPGAGKELPTLASLAPDRCLYVGGVSKSIAPGLRLGYLHCPTVELVEGALRAVLSTVYAPPALGGLFFSDWIEDGSAFEIATAVRREVAARTALAREILGKRHISSIHDAPHFWLPMDELEAERLAGRALRAGVAVTPPHAPVTPGCSVSGIRVCVGAAASMGQLTTGLERLRAVLEAGTVAPAMEMV